MPRRSEPLRMSSTTSRLIRPERGVNAAAGAVILPRWCYRKAESTKALSLTNHQEAKLEAVVCEVIPLAGHRRIVRFARRPC